MSRTKNNNKKEEIIKRFKERLDNNKGVTYRVLKEEDPSLLYAIEKHFGSISKLCAEIGISEDEMIHKLGFTRNINKRTLTEDEILERLLYLKSKGKLTTSAMRTEFDDLRLEISIKKLYGSVENCLKHFGLERDIKRVTKDQIIKKIKEYSEQGVDLCYSNMMVVDPTLVYDAQRKFKKSWHKVLDDLKVPYTAKRLNYSRENIKQRLYAILEEFDEINYNLIKQNDSSILNYAYANYDSLEDFYADMGLNPIECMDFDTQKYKGKMFELTFKEVLDALGIPYQYNKYYNEEIRPDFQLDDGIWIDCKLSSWTQTIKHTVKKYTPYCNKLIIVYLRGNKRKLYEFKDYNVEFRKVSYYYPYLKEINRQDLIDKLESIITFKSDDPIGIRNDHTPCPILMNG